MHWNKLQNRKFDRHKPPYGWFTVREMEQRLKPIQSFQIYIKMLLPHLHKPEDRNIYSVDRSGHGGPLNQDTGKERLPRITWAVWGASDRSGDPSHSDVNQWLQRFGGVMACPRSETNMLYRSFPCKLRRHRPIPREMDKSTCWR